MWEEGAACSVGPLQRAKLSNLTVPQMMYVYGAFRWELEGETEVSEKTYFSSTSAAKATWPELGSNPNMS
jgi:hypothetical protein